MNFWNSSTKHWSQSKIQLTLSRRIVILGPSTWKVNTQPWFQQFVHLVRPRMTPSLIPAHQHLLQLPGTNLQHPIWNWLCLVAAILLDTSQERVCYLDFQLNPYQPTVSLVLDFLHTYELGLSNSAIGIQQSAISAIVEIPKSLQLGEYWLVSWFMKEIFQLKHAQTRYTKSWDIKNVLSYLKSLGPNDSLRLKQMTLKIAALLTIPDGQQIHTLYAQCYPHRPVPW